MWKRSHQAFRCNTWHVDARRAWPLDIQNWPLSRNRNASLLHGNMPMHRKSIKYRLIEIKLIDRIRTTQLIFLHLVSSICFLMLILCHYNYSCSRPLFFENERLFFFTVFKIFSNTYCKLTVSFNDYGPL